MGGEALESGDTKCDLFISDDIRADEVLSLVKSNPAITILTEAQILLDSG